LRNVRSDILTFFYFIIRNEVEARESGEDKRVREKRRGRGEGEGSYFFFFV